MKSVSECSIEWLRLLLVTRPRRRNTNTESFNSGPSRLFRSKPIDHKEPFQWFASFAFSSAGKSKPLKRFLSLCCNLSSTIGKFTNTKHEGTNEKESI